MPWAIYSPEDFPKMQDAGFLADYRIAYGVQIIMKANTWTELHELGYKQEYWNNYVDMRGDSKEIFVSSQQVAERICRDAGRQFGTQYLSVGLVACNTDRTTPAKMKELEELSHKRNREYRQKVVEAFELEFRSKSQGGPGRYTPNAYEADCYKFLGIPIPEVVSRPKEPVQPVIQIVQPDPELMARLVAAEVAKIEAARAVNAKPIKVV